MIQDTCLRRTRPNFIAFESKTAKSLQTGRGGSERSLSPSQIRRYTAGSTALTADLSNPCDCPFVFQTFDAAHSRKALLHKGCLFLEQNISEEYKQLREHNKNALFEERHCWIIYFNAFIFLFLVFMYIVNSHGASGFSTY